MAAAVCADNLFCDYFSILNIVNLELFGMTEVLEDLSVFVSDCDSHYIASFLHDFLIDFNRFIFTAPACNQQSLPMNESIRDLFSRAFIDRGNRGSGNVHPNGAGFLGESFVI